MMIWTIHQDSRVFDNVFYEFSRHVNSTVSL